MDKMNEFYEDELARVHCYITQTKGNLKGEIVRIMDDLQKEEKKKVSLEEKVKYYEETVDVLDEKIEKLLEDICGKNNEIQSANERYSEFKLKFEESDRLNQEKDESNL